MSTHKALKPCSILNSKRVVILLFAAACLLVISLRQASVLPEFQAGEQAVGLGQIIQWNRQTLAEVPSWIRREDWEAPPSLFNYGLPEDAFPKVNLNVGGKVTYADLIGWFALNMVGQTRYLEIGVSVGKTFYQQVRVFNSGSVLIAYDIENINPTLSHLLGGMEVKESWADHKLTHPDIKYVSPRKNMNGTLLKAVGADSKRVFYLASDEFDSVGWSKLAQLGFKFNLILSDALHTRQALEFEWKMLVDHDLLDVQDGFVMLWDDLEGQLKEEWIVIVQKMQNQAIAGGRKLWSKLVSVNGWLGSNEHAHSVGIVSTFPLGDIPSVV